MGAAGWGDHQRGLALDQAAGRGIGPARVGAVDDEEGQLAVDRDDAAVGQAAAHTGVAGQARHDVLDDALPARRVDDQRGHGSTAASNGPTAASNAATSRAWCAPSRSPVHSSIQVFLNSSASGEGAASAC